MIYYTVIRTVALLHGAKCWPTTLKLEQTLHIVEMRIPCWNQELLLDKVSNDEGHSTFGVAPVAAKLREARPRYYGHVLSSEHDQSLNRLCTSL